MDFEDTTLWQSALAEQDDKPKKQRELLRTAFPVLNRPALAGFQPPRDNIPQQSQQMAVGFDGKRLESLLVEVAGDPHVSTPQCHADTIKLCITTTSQERQNDRIDFARS